MAEDIAQALLQRGVRSSRRRLEATGAVLLVSLSSMVCLGLGADPPLVDPGSVRLMDEGTVVIVRGLLVDLKRYESGFESLVVSSFDGKDALRIMVSQGFRPQPSEFVRIGDTLRAFGRVANSGPEAVLYSEGGSVSVESRAETSLTVSTLSRTWHLLLGDELRIHGVIVSSHSSGGCRLFDEDFGCSIALWGEAICLSGGVSNAAVIVGTLRLDGSSMNLLIDVTSFSFL